MEYLNEEDCIFYQYSLILNYLIKLFNLLCSIPIHSRLSSIWREQTSHNRKWLDAKIHLIHWLIKSISNPRQRLWIIKCIKKNWNKRTALTCFQKKDAKTMCRFRIFNHYLPIESGCWVIIPRNKKEPIIIVINKKLEMNFITY